MDLAQNTEHGKVPTQRHYFEAGHGKSPADGIGALVKNAVTRAVTQRRAFVQNAKDFYDHCDANLCQVGDSVFKSKEKAAENSSRVFFYVQSSEVKRPRNREVI